MTCGEAPTRTARQTDARGGGAGRGLFLTRNLHRCFQLPPPPPGDGMEPASCKNNPPLTDDTWIVRRATYRRIVAANYRLSTNVQSCKLPRTPRDSSQKPERATLGSGGAQQFPRRLPAGRERRLAGDLNRGPPDPSLPGRPRRGRSPPWQGMEATAQNTTMAHATARRGTLPARCRGHRRED